MFTISLVSKYHSPLCVYWSIINAEWMIILWHYLLKGKAQKPLYLYYFVCDYPIMFTGRDIGYIIVYLFQVV